MAVTLKLLLAPLVLMGGLAQAETANDRYIRAEAWLACLQSATDYDLMSSEYVWPEDLGEKCRAVEADVVVERRRYIESAGLQQVGLGNDPLSDAYHACTEVAVNLTTDFARWVFPAGFEDCEVVQDDYLARQKRREQEARDRERREIMRRIDRYLESR